MGLFRLIQGRKPNDGVFDFERDHVPTFHKTGLPFSL